MLKSLRITQSTDISKSHAPLKGLCTKPHGQATHLTQSVGLGIQNGHGLKVKVTNVQNSGQHTCAREIPE